MLNVILIIVRFIFHGFNGGCCANWIEIISCLMCLIFKLWQLNREEGKSFLSLPIVPHVGETDSDTLTEIPDRLALHSDGPDEEEEDEYGYSWSESHIGYNTQRPAEGYHTDSHWTR